MPSYFDQLIRDQNRLASKKLGQAQQAYGGINYAPQVPAPNLSSQLGAFGSLVGSPIGPEAAAGRSYLGALQTGGQGELNAGATASGLYDQGYRSSGASYLDDFQRTQMAQLSDATAQIHAQELMAQQQAQQQAFQMAMQLAGQGLSPQAVEGAAGGYLQASGFPYQGNVGSWLEPSLFPGGGQVSPLYQSQQGPPDPQMIGELSTAIDSAVTQAYAHGLSHFGDVASYAHQALMASNPAAYSQFAPMIDQMLASKYRLTNAEMGPGGTAPVAPAPGIGPFDTGKPKPPPWLPMR